MKPNRFLRLAVIFHTASIITGCLGAVDARAVGPDQAQKTTQTCAAERPIAPIPLTGELMTQCGPGCAELSGLAWYQDHLILLPQYPKRFPSTANGTLFAIPKSAIVAYLEGRSERALLPKPIRFVAPDFERSMPGFQGYEAIAFDGDLAILSIELERERAGDRASMWGHLVTGKIKPDLSELRVDPTTVAEIPPQTTAPNMAYETIVVVQDAVISLHEANGHNVNPSPVAHRFDLALRQLQPVPAPTIEYRVTDATSADENGRFWVINFFFFGDKKHLKPAKDELVTPETQGCSHKRSTTVERLVELQYTPTGIRRTDTAPIQLDLGLLPRNWEGIARLDERGFLVVTDQFPQTLLAFVPSP